MKLPLKSKTGIALMAMVFIALVFLVIGRTEPPVRRESLEAVLKADLRTMRDAIDHYTLDKQQAPQSLQDLVNAGYLRAIPVDPITHKTDWVQDFEGPVLGDPVLSPDLEGGRLADVRSNSNRSSLDGSKYNEW
jgi:general secretion pathway protein G